MSALFTQVGPALLALVMGWIVLWPLRRQVGAVAYHLWAMPAGLLIYALAGAVAGVARRPFDLLSVAVAFAVAVLVIWGLVRFLDQDSEQRGASVGAGSYLLTMSVLLVAGAAATVMKWTIVTNDALVQYWPMSIALARGEGFTIPLMSDRGMLIPGIGAAHVMFGAGWSYTVYALIAVNTAALVGWVLWDGFSVAGRRWVRVAATLLLTLFLVTESSFVFHAIFVHSHMYSALYMMMSLVGLWRGCELRRRGSSGTAWLILSGLAAAGLTLARPDGTAYALVVLAAAVAVLTDGEYSGRATAAFFAPFLGSVLGVYIAAFAALGMWEAETKLDGIVALGMLGVLCAAAAVPWLVDRLAPRLPFRLRGDAFLVFSVGVLGAVLVLLAVLIPANVFGAASNSAINLFGGGGAYAGLWYFLVGIAGLSVLSGDAFRAGSLTKYLFLSISIFYLTAGIVHAATHVGRVGDLDSFTRVAFHGLPVAVWYVGAVLMRIAADAAQVE